MAKRPQNERASTSVVNLFFKKNIYLKKKWPPDREEIWKKLFMLDLSPQVHVNAWK